MGAEEIAHRVWPGRVARIEPLGGGITNENFKVELDGEAYVLRTAGKDTHLLGIDRPAEAEATRVSASLGVGPEVVAFLEPERCLVTRFIAGEPIPPERMRSPELLARVALMLRTVHSGPAIPGRFDAHRIVDAYRTTAERHGVRIPERYDRAKELADRIEVARGAQPAVPCHNDLLNANFLDDGTIRLVDWEYAGMGDRFFDLANFSINHELEEAEDEALLAAYFGAAQETDYAALRLMRIMSDFREAMWGVVQQGISELEFDFVKYAAEHFVRLEASASDPRFEDWLAAVRQRRTRSPAGS